MSMGVPRRWLALAAAMLVAAALLVSVSAAPANAAAIYTGHSCAPAGCKYAKAQLYLDRQIKRLYTTYYRGGTASQSCDPSNDINQWKMTKIAATSGMTWSVGAGPWRTHCNVDAFTYTNAVNKNWSGGLDVKFEFLHDAACSGCDFTSIIFQYG